MTHLSNNEELFDGVELCKNCIKQLHEKKLHVLLSANLNHVEILGRETNAIDSGGESKDESKLSLSLYKT